MLYFFFLNYFIVCVLKNKLVVQHVDSFLFFILRRENTFLKPLPNIVWISSLVKKNKNIKLVYVINLIYKSLYDIKIN